MSERFINNTTTFLNGAQTLNEYWLSDNPNLDTHVPPQTSLFLPFPHKVLNNAGNDYSIVNDDTDAIEVLKEGVYNINYRLNMECSTNPTVNPIDIQMMIILQRNQDYVLSENLVKLEPTYGDGNNINNLN